MTVVNAAEMRAADEHAIRDLQIPSIQLMENAAARVVEIILQRYAVGARRAPLQNSDGARRAPLQNSDGARRAPLQVLIVCGKGNNGGDGLAVARLLKAAGWDPFALLLANASELKADPAENWKRARGMGVRMAEDSEGRLLQETISQFDLVVDALFGTGLAKPLTSVFANVVQSINHAGKEVLAVDLPSGLSSDSGQIPGPAVRAHVTVALASLKYGHIIPPSSRMCGEIYVADIGIPVASTTNIVRSADIRRILPHRSVDSNKGTFGHAIVIAGSRGKSGAAYMAGKAALRCGAGLVTIVSPSDVQPLVAGYGPEVMTAFVSGNAEHFSESAARDVLEFLMEKTAVALGPGIGTHPETAQFFERVLMDISQPVVIDADGLNLLTGKTQILRKRKMCSTILTPHPGEMARLLSCDVPTVQKNRIDAAQRLSRETGAIVVLKGYRTIVAEPAGKCWIHLSGGPSLASAGTGDILTGVITGFLAQKLAPLDAAQAGVFLHGLVGNLFESAFPQQALNAMDILGYWNEAVRKVRAGQDLEGEYFKIHFPL